MSDFDSSDLQGVHLHIHLPEALTEMVKATGDRAIHVHLPDGLEKVVRDLGAEILHERLLLRAAIEEMGELLKVQLTPHVTVNAPPVTVQPASVKVRPEITVHLSQDLQGRLTASVG